MLHGGDVYGRKVRYDFSVNVNPRPCPREVRDALIRAVDQVGVYPDLLQREFREKAAEVEGVEPGEVLGGNGASELFMGIANWIRPKTALLTCPSFYGYRHVIGTMGNCEIVEYPLDPLHGFVMTDEILDWIANDIDIVFLGNPNNPTGKIGDPRLLESILKKSQETGTAVVVDECFLRMSSGATTFRRRFREFPNLYVVDAFTKLFSIPGVRAGYMLSNAENVACVRSRMAEWNMSTFSTAASLACLDLIAKTDFVAESLREIERERARLATALRDLGLRVYDSDANYLLFFSEIPLDGELLDREILIRDCHNFAGLAKGFYRVAVRRREENAILVDAIGEILEATR